MKKHHSTCNPKDHDQWSRRSFIQALGLSGIGSMAFANTNITFSGNSTLSAALAAADSDKILLVIKLFGGNDGLNMIIPINEYDLYAAARPTIKIPETSLIKLTDDKGLNNQMVNLEKLWGEGSMKVVNSVGYPSQSKSHFRGTDAWASAEIESGVYDTGWLGRYFENQYSDYLLSPPESPPAIEIGSIRNIAFDGDENKYSFSVASVASLLSIANTGITYPLENLPDCEYGEKLKFLRSTFNNSYSYADKIYQAYSSSSDYTSGDGYPTDDTNLGESLNLIARLIKGNLGTKVYMVTLSGFDTHTNQVEDQGELLEVLSQAVSYFHEDLKQAGWGDKILTMTQSEFGRRVAENGSSGTDHGSSGPIMLFGEGLNGSSFVGEHASLESSELVSNNLDYTTDFRQVYATILKEWMCVDSTIVDSVVLGESYEGLDLGFTCGGSSTSTSSANTLSSLSYFENENTIIQISATLAQHIVVKLYAITGQEIGTLDNSMMYVGTKTINVNAVFPSLSYGYYIYRLSSNYHVESNKMLIQN